MTASEIDLGIIDLSDREPDLTIERTLQDLVNDKIDATFAAKEINRLIVADCEAALATYSDPSTRRKNDRGNIIGPDPKGFEAFLWNLFGDTAQRVPAGHPGQDRVVSLLAKLQENHQAIIKAYAPDGYLYDAEIWTLNHENGFAYLAQWMWEVSCQFLPDTLGDADKAERYLNHQAFLARLLGAAQVDVAGRLGACFSSEWSGTNPVRKMLDVPAYNVMTIAAAGWIRYAGEVLFEIHEKRANPRVSVENWKPTYWAAWKAKFETIAGMDRFNEDARAAARWALGRMKEIDDEGITTNIVDKMHYCVPTEPYESDEDEDDDDDANDEANDDNDSEEYIVY